MEPDASRPPVGEMTERVAKLWRQQGEVFLARHHALVEDDVARLRGAVLVEEAPPDSGRHDRLDATLAKLRGWDHAVIERLRAVREEEDEVAHVRAVDRARRPDAVVDLTGPAPVVVAPPGRQLRGRCRAHLADRADGVCRDCDREFCADCLVYPWGPTKAPLCVGCAMVAGGLRRRTRD